MCTRSPHGLPTPRTWPRPTRSTCATTLGPSGRLNLAEVGRSKPLAPCPAALPRAACFGAAMAALRCYRLAALLTCLAPRCCCCRRIVIAFVPVRCTLCAAASPVQGRHCRSHVAELAVTLSFMTFRPRGPRRSKGRAAYRLVPTRGPLQSRRPYLAKARTSRATCRYPSLSFSLSPSTIATRHAIQFTQRTITSIQFIVSMASPLGPLAAQPYPALNRARPSSNFGFSPQPCR